MLRETLGRIRGLKPEVIHGGHSPSFGTARLGELIDEYLAGGLRIDDFKSWMGDRMIEWQAGTER